MKQKVSPPMIVGIILVVIAALGFIGYKIFVAKDSAGSAPPAMAVKWTKPAQNGQAEHMTHLNGGAPPGMGRGAAGMGSGSGIRGSTGINHANDGPVHSGSF